MKFNFLVNILLIGCLQSIVPIFSRDYNRHKVKLGDNLTKISNRYNVPIYKILKNNHLKSKNKIFVGQILKIPKKRRRSRKKTFSHVPNFKSPVRNKRLMRGFDLKGQYRTPGVLWRLRNNYNIHSSSSGSIVKIGYIRGYGKYIMIDHGRGWISFYSNLSKVFVRKNEKVFNFQKIGIAKNKKFFFSISHKGKPLNPIFLLKMNLKKLKIS